MRRAWLVIFLAAALLVALEVLLILDIARALLGLEVPYV